MGLVKVLATKASLIMEPLEFYAKALQFFSKKGLIILSGRNEQRSRADNFSISDPRIMYMTTKNPRGETDLLTLITLS